MLFKKILFCIFIFFGIITLIECTLYIIGFIYYPYNAYDLSVKPAPLFNRTGNEYKAGPINILGAQSFQVNKNRNVYRIILLGGSSVYNLGSAEILKAKVQNITHKEVEIINSGLLSQGTNTLIKVLPELLTYQPNLLVIYSGHNEFLSTYLKEVYQKINSSNAFVNVFKNSHIYQLITLMSDRATSALYLANLSNQHKLDFRLSSGVDEGISFDNEFRNQIYENYRSNLKKMVSLAHNSNIPVILSTVAYNRRAEPWHVNNNSPYLNDFNKCNNLYAENKYNEAKICYESIISNDTFPVRSTNTQNEIVKEVAFITNTPLSDIDAKIVSSSPHQIPGYDLFNDHCHLNDKGNELLQETIAETIVKFLQNTSN